MKVNYNKMEIGSAPIHPVLFSGAGKKHCDVRLCLRSVLVLMAEWLAQK